MYAIISSYLTTIAVYGHIYDEPYRRPMETTLAP